MPLMNKNYVTPAWIDNAAPPINDDELNAMSETLEGSQILVGNGAPTSSTPGKVGQRYADISTTPATIYVASAGFEGQPIPVVESAQQVVEHGYLLFTKSTSSGTIEYRIASLGDTEVTALLVLRESINTIQEICFCRRPYFEVIACEYNRTTGSIRAVNNFKNNGLKFYDTGLYYTLYGAATAEDSEIIAPIYSSTSEANTAAANPPAVWKQEDDPNRNLARPYSTGSSYVAGDYCIHEGKLWRALAATSGAWDGSKWEQAKYTDDLSGHEVDQNNPHNVTAAQTGAVSPPVLATVQATTAAVRDYFAGEYFFYDGQLYEVKEAVEQGGDLFEPRTPDTVSVYELDAWYDGEAFDSNQPNAQVIKSGFQLTSYRTNQYSTGKIESGAKYFFAWIQNANTTQSAVVYYSKEETDFPTDNGEWVYYIDRTDSAEIANAWRGSNRGTSATGEYYYKSWIQPTPSEGLPYTVRRPVNARMFSGTEDDLFDFIGGISQYKKSEPAVLSDGISTLHTKTGSVALGATWTGSDPYSQTVTLSGVTVTGKSKVDLTPTAAQLDALAQDGVISLMIENNGGTLTAWAVGGTPSAAMTISCTVTETV